MANSDDSDGLSFESMSTGGSRSAEPALELVFEDAAHRAMVDRDISFSVDRVALSLLSNADVEAELTRAGVDSVVVSQRLEVHLGAQTKSEAGFRAPTDPNLRAVLHTIIVKHFSQKRQRLMSSLDVLAVIMEQNDSFAADTLRDYGYTPETSLETANTHFAVAQQKDADDLRAIKDKLSAALRSNAPYWAVGPRQKETEEDPHTMQHYRIVVTSRDSKNEVEFKGAVSQDGAVTLLIEETPFEFEFLATQVIAVFDALSGKEGISAEIFLRQLDGTERTMGRFGGHSGALLEDRRDRAAQWRSGHFE